MEEHEEVRYFHSLIQDRDQGEQINLIKILREIIEPGGVFTINFINSELSQRGIGKIDETILEAFLAVLVKEFKYTVEPHTLH